MKRTEILDKANTLITGDRAASYGDYSTQMSSIAASFNAMYHGDKEAPYIEARHVSMLLMLLKLRRRVTSGDKDSSVDLCGYAALDAEFFSKVE